MKKFKLIVCTLMMFMCVCSASLYAKGGTNTAPSNNQEVQANGPGSESHPILNFLKSIISKLGGKSGGGTNATANNSKNEQVTLDNKSKELNSEKGGDPVLLTSGQYFQSETDIAMKTLTGAVGMVRYYTSGGSTGGNTLGSRWTGNIETRLVRGISAGYEHEKEELEANYAELKANRQKLDEELAKSGGSLQGEDVETVAEADKLILDMEGEIAYLNALAEKRKKLEQLNKYAKYGKCCEHSATGNDTLILMQEGYIPIVFEYKQNGRWESVTEKYKNVYTITSRNGKDALEADGFILKAKNGSSQSFDKWGLLENITDRNGNVTSFVRNSEKKLAEIKSDTGTQSLKFAYNGEGLLIKIELYEGGKSAGQSVAYTYSGKLLETVTDTDGDTSRFVYNSDNNLEKLIKPDGSFVEFKYGLMDKDGNLYTTQTVNEEGHAERFDYDRANKITTYTDHDGVTTIYKYDDDQQITEEKYADGSTVKTAYNTAGNVTSKTVNGSTTTFVYDTKDNLIKVQYADGSSENFTYDSSNNCIKAVDRDGIITEFRYDAKGNCIGVIRGGQEAVNAQYNNKGLVTDIYRNGGSVTGRTHFDYDAKGNATSRTAYTKNAVIKETWTYDEQNRVLSYIDGEGQKYTYSYTEKTVTEKTPAGLERTYTTNGRKDLILIEETDTSTGEKRIFKYDYDKRHLVTAVKAGSSFDNLETVVSYTYTKAGKALTETRKDEDASWITEYVYDGAGRIESVKRSKADKYGKTYTQPITQKYAYANTASGREFTLISPEGSRTVISYDRWNRVTDVKNALNENSHRSLSSGGRTVKEESSHGGLYTYGYDNAGNLASLGEQNKKQAKVEYNPDGSTKSVTDRLGNVTTFEYDERGLLTKQKSPSCTTIYEYDNVGRIKTVLVGSGSGLTKANATQYVEYEYSDAGRTVKVKAGGLYETTYTLNAWGEVTAVTDGMGNTIKYEYDSIGRTKAIYDAYGAKSEYTYNAVGRISSITAPNGAKKTYEYNELYLVTKAEDGEGVFFESRYNRDGLLIAEKARPGVDKEYSYDKLGRIVEVKTGGDVTERYRYTTKGRTVTFTDGKGSDYVYSYDEFGRLVSEKNRIDGTQSYTYNDNAELKAKKDFEGNVTEIFYDEKTRTSRTKYADGTESVIVYDECGNVLSATNESGTLSYAYDKAGMLIKETDSKTGETVSYFYDKAGRRTRLVSRERDISYGYGKNSELLSQKDRLKQLEVHYKYDVCGREIERRFGNGVVQKTRYDKAGRTVNIAQYTSNGNLISGEAYVYDNLGRRSMTVNEKGLVTVYKYDNQSRLETVYYPFNEDIKETARKEADKQGLYFQSSQGNPENYFLSSAEMMQLRGVAENFARLRGNAITTNQVVWKESYTYDANGNRTSKTTAWGTVEYSYDKENRLIESGELGKSESVKYTYDANGNLLRESAARYRKDYVYNAQNRMSFSDVQDSVLNTRNFTEYAYDAFGRRIETKEYLGDYTRNLYDGFSFDVLGKSVLQSAYSANVPVQKYRDGQSGHPELVSGSASNGRNERGTEIGTRYRYIDDTPLVPMTETGKANGTNIASSASGAKTRSRPNNEYVLYSYGEPVAMSADGNASYFGTDILGSVRSVTDKSGTLQADYSYDAFGSPYLGNLENDIGFGYCGKVYDIGTGLYDYGFRDYSPVSARFTTVDPIRDGSNWFSYVVNDPVNYVDPFGLDTTDSTSQTQHAIQESSPGLKALTFVKYLVSGAMALAGLVTGNPFLVAGAVIVSQVPTGMVVNKTNYNVAFASEHGNIGENYLQPGITFTRSDFIVTQGIDGVTSKGFSFGDYTITNGEIKPSIGTKIVNAVANGFKSLLQTEPGDKINSKISEIRSNTPKKTTEPYGVYDTQQVLDNNVPKKGKAGNETIDLHGLSGNLNDFRNPLKDNSNPEYLQ
ncbi:MAG: RHS repeat-associated core domain-containing protein [Spirochaetaceae bacterium]|nr:RHS repeat-associated core domain-containing protein [Spirochaetaceae bacterium]